MRGYSGPHSWAVGSFLLELELFALEGIISAGKSGPSCRVERAFGLEGSFQQGVGSSLHEWGV